MFAIIYKGEVLDTAETIEEAEYITAEYNCAFRENGAVKWKGVADTSLTKVCSK